MSVKSINQLEPQLVFQAFSEISAIPRGSGNEAAIIAYLESQANAHQVPFRRDAIGNLLIQLPATCQKANTPGITLQGHVDMVCEKVHDSDHNFQTQGLELYLEGNLIRARGTSLGADNGIAVAMMLAIMRSNLEHGPIDLLFTIDEETGLSGALGLDPSMLRFDYLINIDSEEEGIIYIGCAGGIEELSTIPLDWIKPNSDLIGLKITIQGLCGGHSGTDIANFRANALVLLGRVLFEFVENYKASIHELNGGFRHNVIPRDASMSIAIPLEYQKQCLDRIAQWQLIFNHEYGPKEQNLVLISEKTSLSGLILSDNSALKIARFFSVIPHGVLSMSRHIENLVSTSTNFAACKIEPGASAIISTSQRADSVSLRTEANNKIRSLIELAGGKTKTVNSYPAWTPNPESRLLQLALKIHQKVLAKKAIVSSIHAGLETGVIGSKIPGLQMISFGPDIRGAHSPSESLDHVSTKHIWQFLIGILQNLEQINVE